MRAGRRPWRVVRAGLGLGLILAGFGFGAVAAAAELKVENLKVGFSGAGQGQENLYKIGAWTPVWVQLQGGSERFAGTMELEVPDDDGTPTYVRQAVDVGPNQPARVVVYARTGVRDPNFMVRFYDRQGNRLGRPVDGSELAQARNNGQGLTSVSPDETLLLTLGNPQGVDQIPKLPGFTSDRSASGSDVLVARLDAGAAGAAADLPGRWLGYDGASAVVLDGNDRAAIAALGTRGQALVDWVARGGHLVVAAGSNWQALRDSAVGPILPAVPSGRERLPSLAALDTFAGASRSVTPVGSPPSLVTKLERAEARGGKVLSSSNDLPLVVRGPHGFGLVTVVAVDVDAKPFSDWPDRALFWVKALDLRRQGGDPAGAAATAVRITGGGRRLTQSGVNDLATILRMALEQFPGVRLVPFGWVAFFIFLYIVLIGPGDYLFLKYVVKRMELTWVTFPLIVLAVSLAAYSAAYAVKGTDLRVNKLDVVDVDQPAGLARGSTFIDLFSPQNRDYDISVVPLTLTGPAPAKDELQEMAATDEWDDETYERPAGTEVSVSWLGVPESGFGGMGNTGRLGLAGAGYSFEPDGGSEVLRKVRVPIWSTKLLTARWFGPSPAVADADLQPEGPDRLKGTVTNRLAVPMNNALLVFNKHVYELDTIAPRATVRVELKRHRQLSGLLKDRSRFQKVDALEPDTKLSRPDLALTLMFHDSQGAALAERMVASNPLHYLDLTGQVALGRPMLVARLDRPAARLVLDNVPSKPKTDQTTMLRAILPLNRPAGEGNE